jgi:hypothetical protein
MDLESLRARALHRLAYVETNSDPLAQPWQKMLDAINRKDERLIEEIIRQYPEVQFSTAGI